MSEEPTAPTPAGWRLTLPLANLKGEEKAKGGSWAAAIPDRSAARKAIPYGASVPSAPLQPLTATDIERLGLAPGEVRKIQPGRRAGHPH